MSYMNLDRSGFQVTGEYQLSTQMFEGYKSEIQSKSDGTRVAVAKADGIEYVLDVDWLRAASKTYQVSDNIKDFVFVEVPGLTIDIPNRNMDEFGYDVVTEFSPRSGRFVFRTFVGKPTCKDHNNKDVTKAVGINFDSFLVPWSNGYYKIKTLSGFDRSKDSILANEILTKKRIGYSMGALVGESRCSICNAVSCVPAHKQCIHFRNYGKGKLFQGKLIYDRCRYVEFIEMSSVLDPADVTAVENKRVWE